ncbi:gas vesicle protein [Actinacidiphila acidipaludis]|uniref:Gas vesicle protein n=1 Tax=Actinacidiphila acidipaludis TaxID=2873382 RepID=A0ABS7QJZ1_9ACTN|nr:gas vesicle protein [Streptomyces acidipaludis]MBY8882227.1 gas vesicle protein [Streptomyces acidipaludis]
MNQPAWTGASSTRSPSREADRPQAANLADILERVLDKGIVIAGDIRIDLLDIELLTIKIRLIVASVDRAREMGIDWWEHDPSLSSGDRDVLEENRRLRRRIGDLEAEGSAERAAALDRDDGAGREVAAERREEPDEQDRREDEAGGSRSGRPAKGRSRSGRNGDDAS